jgi:hypothetical protein
VNVLAKQKLVSRLYAEWAAKHGNDPEDDPKFIAYVAEQLAKAEKS